MRLYIEPIVFHNSFSESETGILPRLVFKKAKEGKIEIMTSILTITQFIGAVHELLVTKKIDKQSHLNSLVEYSRLEMYLKDSLTYVYPTKEIHDIGVSYILDRDVYYERAWHLATAKASKCNVCIIGDRYHDIDKKDWESDFEIFNVLDEKDVSQAIKKIDEL